MHMDCTAMKLLTCVDRVISEGRDGPLNSLIATLLGYNTWVHACRPEAIILYKSCVGVRDGCGC